MMQLVVISYSAISGDHRLIINIPPSIVILVCYHIVVARNKGAGDVVCVSGE